MCTATITHSLCYVCADTHYYLCELWGTSNPPCSQHVLSQATNNCLFPQTLVWRRGSLMLSMYMALREPLQQRGNELCIVFENMNKFSLFICDRSALWVSLSFCLPSSHCPAAESFGIWKLSHTLYLKLFTVSLGRKKLKNALGMLFIGCLQIRGFFSLLPTKQPRFKMALPDALSSIHPPSKTSCFSSLFIPNAIVLEPDLRCFLF